MPIDTKYRTKSWGVRGYHLVMILMPSIFQTPLMSEILSPEELAEITGAVRKADQTEWLTSNGWAFHRNRAGEPIVGRIYARLRMAGINPTSVLPAPGLPDFSKVR